MTVSKAQDTCRAVQVTPGVAHSARIGSEPVPTPGPGELLLRVLEVGICGTDAEIDAGLYGATPSGEDHLVPGHESLAEVEAVGPGVEGWRVGDLGIPIVRRPCPELCPTCAQGRWDMCETGHYRERGISGLHGMLRELMVDTAEFVVPVPRTLRQVGVLLEPLSIVEKAIREALRLYERSLSAPRRALVTGAGPIGLLAAMVLVGLGIEVYVLDRRTVGSPKAAFAERLGANYLDDSRTPLEEATKDLRFDLVVEASGYAPLVFRALGRLARNGAMVLTGVTAGHHTMSFDADVLNQEMVLENHLLLGSVNAARVHYVAAIRDLEAWHARDEKLLGSMITDRFPLERFRDALQKSPDAIKSVVEVSHR